MRACVYDLTGPSARHRKSLRQTGGTLIQSTRCARARSHIHLTCSDERSLRCDEREPRNVFAFASYWFV